MKLELIKIKRGDLWDVTIQTTPINPSEFTITITTKKSGGFVLTPWDVVDACKEYVIRYQKELMLDERYYQLEL